MVWRMTVLATILASGAASCLAAGPEETGVEEVAAGDEILEEGQGQVEEEPQEGPRGCVDIGEMDEELLGILLDEQELWERLEFPICRREDATTWREVFDSSLARSAQRVFADEDFLERFVASFQDGVWLYSAPQDGGPGRKGMVLSVARFDDESVVHEAVPLLLQARFRAAGALATPLEPLREIEVAELGDASFGARGSMYRNEVNAYYIWARGRLLLLAGTWSGDPEQLLESEVLEISRVMDSRAASSMGE
jgi:hypothetical protein